MKSRLQFAAFMAGFLVLACWVSWPPSEPAWEGRPVSQWLEELSLLEPNSIMFSLKESELSQFERNRRRKSAEEAIRQIGPSVIPYLLKQFELGRKPWAPHPLGKVLAFVGWKTPQPPSGQEYFARGRIGFEALGEQGVTALPELQRLLHDPTTAGSAAACLAAIGKPALPAFESALASKDRGVFLATQHYVRSLETNAIPLLPALRARLEDPDREVQFLAAAAYFYLEPSRSNVVQTLIHLLDAEGHGVAAWVGISELKRRSALSEEFAPVIARLVGMAADTNVVNQRNGIRALGKLDPSGTHARPQIIAATLSPSALPRSEVCLALGRMTNSPTLVLPKLADLALNDPDEVVRGSAVKALAAFGEAGINAVPDLAEEIRLQIEFRIGGLN